MYRVVSGGENEVQKTSVKKKMVLVPNKKSFFRDASGKFMQKNT